MYFWISKNHAEFWISIIRFKDIRLSNYGYPKFNMIFGYQIMYLRISLNIAYFWISIIRFLDINNTI